MSTEEENTCKRSISLHPSPSPLSWRLVCSVCPRCLPSVMTDKPLASGTANSGSYFSRHRASLVVQIVKKPPTVQEMQVRSLDWEDPLEEGMATHSSILAWRIPWTQETDGPQSMGLHWGQKELDTTEQLTLSLHSQVYLGQSNPH